MLRGRRSCAISERSTLSPFVSSSLLHPLTPLFPLDASHSPVTPLFPLHTQKQGGTPPLLWYDRPFHFGISSCSIFSRCSFFCRPSPLCARSLPRPGRGVRRLSRPGRDGESSFRRLLWLATGHSLARRSSSGGGPLSPIIPALAQTRGGGQKAHSLPHRGQPLPNVWYRLLCVPLHQVAIVGTPTFLRLHQPPCAIFRFPTWTTARLVYNANPPQLKEGNCDYTAGSCVQRLRWNRGGGFNHGRQRVRANQIGSRRPGRARRPGGCRRSAEGSDGGRDGVLPGWAGAVRGNRGRDQWDEQWSRSALQLEPVFVLPFAAGSRRIEPGAKPPDRRGHLEWGKEHCALVRHTKWPGPRGALQE